MELDQPRPKRTQIMTLKEVAKYLGVHEITVYRLIKETDIPVVKLRGQWRFKKDVLDAWLVSRMDKRNGACSEKAQNGANMLQNGTAKPNNWPRNDSTKKPS